MPAEVFGDGDIFDRLTIIGCYHEKVGFKWKHLCQCECGVVKSVYGTDMQQGKTRSCGCLNRESSTKRNTTHGHGGMTGGSNNSITYTTWQSMKARCYNVNQNCYYHYGGNGITVCDSWKDDFAQFLKDMGERPSRDYCLDRVDSEKNYEPGNCRWVTKADNARFAVMKREENIRKRKELDEFE